MATKDYKELARQARLKILKMVHEAGTSHIASNFSIVDVATVLYENLKEKDEVVWSAGWKAASIYYFLAKQGKIPESDLDLFGKEVNGEIKYLGLAETTTPGVWANGGAMGHGLPIAVGMALAKKMKGEEGTVYCIMSDGEMNEGTTWESAMFAAHHKLDNLVVIVDKNEWQAMGKTSEVLAVNIGAAFNAGFNWNWFGIDGHDLNTIEKTLNKVSKLDNKAPCVIVAHTIKGKGVSFMENHLLFHYKHIEKDEYDKAVKELS